MRRNVYAIGPVLLAASLAAGEPVSYNDVYLYGLGFHTDPIAGSFQVSSSMSSTAGSVAGEFISGVQAGPGWRIADGSVDPVFNTFGVTGSRVTISFDEPVASESVAVYFTDQETGSSTILANGPDGVVPLELFQQPTNATCFHTLSGSTLGTSSCLQDGGAVAIITGAPGSLTQSVVVTVNAGVGDFVGVAVGIVNPCPIDADRNGVLDLADINAFIGSFVAESGIADLNPDGIFDLADIAAFIDSFVSGCP